MSYNETIQPRRAAQGLTLTGVYRKLSGGEVNVL